MAFDMVMKIEGVTGESVRDGHTDDIDILAWSWGITQAGTTHRGTGSGAGKANFQDLQCTKNIDKSTSAIMAAIAQGKHFDKIELWCKKVGGDESVDYLKFTLNHCLITSYSTGGSGGEDDLTETFSINFREYICEYTPQNKDGTPGASVQSGFNIAELVPV